MRAPALLVLAAALIAALPPLHEVDLAQHLATGEWIVRNGTVPFTEPFAWTRAGEPYFAYSWLAQVTFYVLLDVFGPVGLHALEAAIIGSAVAAALWAGRQFGWDADTRLGVAALHLALLWGVGNTLRPQQVLFIAIPLAWGIAARIRARGVNARRLLALLAVGTIAVNTHIFFPMTAVPVAYYLCMGGRVRTWAATGLALAAGWLLTPYVLVWPQIFALNFGHNVLLARPPSILEFVPGFEYALQRTGVMIAAGVLLAAPWLPSGSPLTARERAVRATFWIAGLLLFAWAGRLILAWWALAFPIAGGVVTHGRAALAYLPTARIRRAVSVSAIAIIFVAAAPPISPVFWYFEGGTEHRMLPRAGEDPALWLPSWLLCNTRNDASGRIFTEFNYGSELNWRLPGYSPSIDGRTIFPDSVAVDFSFQLYGRQRRHASTWTSADLALLDRSFWLAPVLDQHPDWVLLAEGRRTSRGTLGALWAKREWWRSSGNDAIIPATGIYPGDPRGVCDVTGVFPALHWPNW